jgi:hypothetical protein
MILEVGIHTRGLRLRLILQSQDVDTHSRVCDNADFFGRLLEQLQGVAIEALKEFPVGGGR